MKYNSVGLIIGRKCTVSCEMCCYDCNTERTEALDPDVVLKYINSAKDLPFIKLIGFSGGEAMLQYDNLKEYLRCAKEIGKYTGVTTNGFWATDFDTAKERICELKEAGLSKLGISYDEFHAEQIPAQNIINILKAAKAVGMFLTIQSSMLNDSNAGNWLGNLGSYIVDQKIDFFPCQPVGAAKKNISDDRFIRRTPVCGGICNKGKTFSILYDGAIYPCCKPFVFNTELKLGNIYDKDMDIAASLEALRSNNILFVLRNYGFDFFLDIARTELDIELPEYVISPCELCGIFFSKENIYKFIPYVYQKIKELNGKELVNV